MNQDRRKQIADLIAVQRTVTNAELMERFGISIETVRRDLGYLERQGVLERVYGGAVKKTFINTEPSYGSRETENHREKWAIATEAEKLIQSRDTVFFDLGTTIQFLAQQLKNKEITVFTNALRTAIVLSETEGCQVVIPGGRLRSHELAVSGILAESSMQQFNVDKAIIGAAGITEEGVTDFQAEEAHLRSQIIKNARQVILLADHSKFGVKTVYNVCDLDSIDVLITDEKAPANILAEFSKKGIRVIVARSNE